MATLTSDQIMTATDDLVAAFAATDTSAYFACFSPEATFVFRASIDLHVQPTLPTCRSRRGLTQAFASWLRNRPAKSLELAATAPSISANASCDHS